jgi:hypothetical protein
MAQITVDQLVPKIENALKAVRARSNDLGITLVTAEVELSLDRTTRGEGGLKFEFFVEVDVGGSQKRSRGQTLSLKLTPKGGSGKLGDAESDELAEAILGLAGAIKRAATPSFKVTEGTVEVEFAVTTDGKLKVVVAGGEHETKGGHKMKLSFKPTPGPGPG